MASLWDVSLFLVLVSGLIAAAEGSQRYDGYHLLRTVPRNSIDCEKLAALQDVSKVDFWSDPSNTGRPVDIFVSPERVDPIMKYLNNNGMEVEVSFDDAEKLIQRSISPRAAFGDQLKLDWKDYHTIDTIYNWLVEQSTTYEIATLITAGNTFEGRELMGLRIAFEPNLPIVFIEGGIHAREWISPATATWIIQQVLNTTNELIKAFEWHIFPIVNPDGYVYTHTKERCWRKNRNAYAQSGPVGSCVGVDLNRNFPYRWRSSKTSENSEKIVITGLPTEEGFPTCKDDYSGPSAASELEVQGLVKYLNTISSRTSVYFALHSYGQLLLHPFSHSKHEVPVNAETLARVGAKAVDQVAHIFGTWYFSGHLATVLYFAPGTSIDFACSSNIPYSYILELRDKGEYGFLLPKEQIIPTAKEAFYILSVILQDAYNVLFPPPASNPPFETKVLQEKNFVIEFSTEKGVNIINNFSNDKPKSTENEDIKTIDVPDNKVIKTDYVDKSVEVSSERPVVDVKIKEDSNDRPISTDYEDVSDKVSNNKLISTDFVENSVKEDSEDSDDFVDYEGKPVHAGANKGLEWMNYENESSEKDSNDGSISTDYADKPVREDSNDGSISNFYVDKPIDKSSSMNIDVQPIDKVLNNRPITMDRAGVSSNAVSNGPSNNGSNGRPASWQDYEGSNVRPASWQDYEGSNVKPASWQDYEGLNFGRASWQDYEGSNVRPASWQDYEGSNVGPASWQDYEGSNVRPASWQDYEGSNVGPASWQDYEGSNVRPASWEGEYESSNEVSGEYESSNTVANGVPTSWQDVYRPSYEVSKGRPISWGNEYESSGKVPPSWQSTHRPSKEGLNGRPMSWQIVRRPSIGISIARPYSWANAYANSYDVSPNEYNPWAHGCKPTKKASGDTSISVLEEKCRKLCMSQYAGNVKRDPWSIYLQRLHRLSSRVIHR